MSDVALLRGAERRLRDALGDAAGAFVGVQPGGQPPPSFGQWYAGIDVDFVRQADQGPHCLDETYALLVVVTARLAYAPQDRRAERAMAAGELRAKAAAVRAALHGSYAVLAYANAEIGAAANGFVEPLTLRGAARASARPPSWVHAEGQDSPPSVWAVELRFDGARRVQVLEEMT